MTERLTTRPEPDQTYITISDVNGTERYVLVEDVYLPGDKPGE